jgi:hypothetical protein
MVIGEVNDKTRKPKSLGAVRCKIAKREWDRSSIWITARHAYAFPLNRCGPCI